MNRNELITKMSEKTGMTKKDLKRAEESFEEAIIEALENGEDVTLQGFVTFKTKIVEEHTAKNPQSQEEVIIPRRRCSKAILSKIIKHMEVK